MRCGPTAFFVFQNLHLKKRIKNEPIAPQLFALLCLLVAALSPPGLAVRSAMAMGKLPSFATSIDRVQPKLVKIYGAGGFRGLEAYQSGFLISSEGHVLTVWSYVLDTDAPTA